MASIVRVEAPPKTSAVSAVARAIARNSAFIEEEERELLGQRIGV
jgi:hypothetical protein